MRHLLLMVALLLALGAFAQEAPWCELVSYGDLVQWRDNNLAGPAYSSHLASVTETRLIVLPESRLPHLYLKANLAMSNETIAEENTLTHGVGVEYYPLAGNETLEDRPSLEWLTHLRLYGEYLRQTSLNEPKPAWNPRRDTAAGFDLWRPYGAADPARRAKHDRRWGELFLGAAYHTTDFYLQGYDSTRIGANGKVGTVLGSACPVMPYLVLDVNTTTEHDFFWQNRLIGGAGLRVQRPLGDAGTLKFFVEGRHVMQYLKASPTPADRIPRNDVVLGVTYDFNRH